MLISWTFSATGAEQLTALELQGRQIYQFGQDDSHVAITVTLGLTNTQLSAQTFPCVNCHGADGEGKVEGSLQIPPINAASLFTRINNEGRSRAAYNEQSLAQVIRTGQGANGQYLLNFMPFYSLANPQMAALIAYLKRLGSASDLDPGLSQESIQLGSIQPLTGALTATGMLLKATLEACVAEANTKGLIYGRSLSLVTEDSESSGTGAIKAKQRLLGQQPVFALVSSYGVEAEKISSDPLMQSVAPNIAPITFMPNVQAAPDAVDFYVLPGYVDQARALVDFSVSLPEFNPVKGKATLAIITGERLADRQAAANVRLQADLQGLTIIDELHYQAGKSAKAIKTLLAKQPAAIFFFGNIHELNALNAILKHTTQPPMLFSLMAMLGREIMEVADLAFARVYLATPFNYDAAALNHLTARLTPHGVPLQNPGLQSVSCAAVDLIVEGLKQSGRHVSRLKLAAALEELRNFPVDFLPPVSFASNAKTGLRGAYVISINQLGELISQSAWISPKSTAVE